MSSTDLANVSAAVAGIQIDGPATSTTAPTGRVELTEESALQVLPGELDPAVGSQPQPVTAAEPEPDPDLPEDDDDEPLEEAARANPDALFDPHAYDTTPVLDGQATDTIQITLGGGVKLAASEDEAWKLFKALRLGRWVDLRVSGFVAAKQGSYKENKDGESQVVGKVTVKAVDVSLIRPEDL
jgi:hypothetical protein